MFCWLHDVGFIDQNPSRKIKEPKVGKRIPKFLTEREIEYSRDACITSMEKSFLSLCFQAGC